MTASALCPFACVVVCFYNLKIWDIVLKTLSLMLPNNALEIKMTNSAISKGLMKKFESILNHTLPMLEMNTHPNNSTRKKPIFSMDKKFLAMKYSTAITIKNVTIFSSPLPYSLLKNCHLYITFSSKFSQALYKI